MDKNKERLNVDDALEGTNMAVTHLLGLEGEESEAVDISMGRMEARDEIEPLILGQELGQPTECAKIANCPPSRLDLDKTTLGQKETQPSNMEGGEMDCNDYLIGLSQHKDDVHRKEEELKDKDEPLSVETEKSEDPFNLYHLIDSLAKRTHKIQKMKTLETQKTLQKNRVWGRISVPKPLPIRP